MGLLFLLVGLFLYSATHQSTITGGHRKFSPLSSGEYQGHELVARLQLSNGGASIRWHFWEGTVDNRFGSSLRTGWQWEHLVQRSEEQMQVWGLALPPNIREWLDWEGVFLPLWPLPVLWAILWLIRMIRAERREANAYSD
ncbi:hypothetical protein HAHE_28560 [Haloferula helveola]|uniref:Uncharacterized protein n=1 Tax=Haloferula helveola TaxID=490095 RepID=A0ABN6H5W8_9BACT|nr:hypothetical protein HAHE_28560 [Haloferula helveola]